MVKIKKKILVLNSGFYRKQKMMHSNSDKIPQQDLGEAGKRVGEMTGKSRRSVGGANMQHRSNSIKKYQNIIRGIFKWPERE